MRRRDFIGVLSGAAIALPLAAQAQQVIGIARLRYRPQTRMTAAWFAKCKERSEAWQAVYEAIAGKDGAMGQIVA